MESKLEKQEGFLRHIHSSLLERKEGEGSLSYDRFAEKIACAIQEVQKQAISCLLNCLADKEAELLLTGDLSQEISSRLENSGHHVKEVSLDLIGTYKSTDSISPCSPQKFFDCFIAFESTQNIEPLNLFNQAFSLLEEDGEVLIIGEMENQRNRNSTVCSLPYVDSMIAQAGRCGFVLSEKMDLSPEVQPIFSKLLEVFSTDKNFFPEEGTPSDVEAVLHEHNVNYVEKCYGYFLLRFKKSTSPKWRLSLATPSDYKDVSRLFYEVFGKEMTEAQWNWKYGKKGARAVLGWKDGRLISHYGGFERRVSYFGKYLSAIQVCDVMVAPEERAAMTRKGPFSRSAKTFIENNTGYGTKHQIAYGFPNRRHLRLAELLGLYEEVGEIVEVRWASKRAQPKNIIPVVLGEGKLEEKYAKWVELLWEEMLQDGSGLIIGVRDWAWIVNRYLLHPVCKYEVFFIGSRLKGKPRALIVLKRQGDRCLWVDTVAPLKQLPLLIDDVQRVSGALGFKSLNAWVSKPFSAEFLSHGGTLTELDILIPANALTPSPDPAELRDRWWLMAGDADFI